MKEKGWIKLHRKILDCWIWNDKPYDKARAWIDLLLLAMHRDKKLLLDNEVVVISRGSFMTSIVKLSERWGWSRCKVIRYLELLENEQMLNTKRTPKGTLVTIVKYEDYQISDFNNDTTLDTTDDTTNETPNNTTGDTQKKNIKNVKNKKNNNSMSISDANALFEELWKLYPRKKGKGQISDAKKKKLLQVGREQMIRAIERYRQYVDNQSDLQYQYGSTFFNSGYVDYIDENYAPNDEKPKKQNARNRFDNFESRSYDIDSLEQKLLDAE